MSVLQWNRPEDKSFQSGLDKGVLYMEDGPVVPWNGLQTVEDNGESELLNFYLDGVQYLGMASPRDWKGTVTCVTVPSEFYPAMGIGTVGDGFYADSQPQSRFSMSYRTLVTTPDGVEPNNYKIHLIYKCVASLQGFSHETLSSSGSDPVPYQFELSATPMPVSLMRPTAHFVFDTREMDEPSITALETILYGSSTTAPRVPTITELIDLLRFSNVVVVHDNGDGTWTATGSNANIVQDLETGRFTLNNVPVASGPDGSGRYTLTTTP